MEGKDSLPFTGGIDRIYAVGIYSMLEKRCKATRSPPVSVAFTPNTILWLSSLLTACLHFKTFPFTALYRWAALGVSISLQLCHSQRFHLHFK